MRKIFTASVLVALLAMVTLVAQTRTFTKKDIEYLVELPSPAWVAVPRLDVHDHVDFIFGTEAKNGYLRVRKKIVVAGDTPENLYRNDEKWELQSLPGYVACSACTGENFDGRLKGATFAYEYTSGGTPMAGRLYYLRVDERTYYMLHFTVAANKRLSLRGDMDLIAASFRLK